MKHDMIVLMGGPGAGKGTIAALLRDKNDFTYIETGAMLRGAPADSEIAKIISRGDLVPDNLLFDIIGQNISDTHNILMDGFPRTVAQAQWLVKTYAHKFNIRVIYLNVSEQIIRERLAKRLRLGSTRADDADASVVQHRLDTFFNTTMPAIEWLRGAGDISFLDIDATGTPDEITKTINKILWA